MRTPDGSSYDPVTVALTPFPLRLRGYSIDVRLWPGSAKLRVHRSDGCRDDASTISMMGVRGATPAAPSPRRAVTGKQFPLQLGHSTSTDGGNATKTRLTGADAFDIELFAAHSVPRDEIPRLMHRPKGVRRQDHSLALGPRTYIHRCPVILA